MLRRQDIFKASPYRQIQGFALQTGRQARQAYRQRDGDMETAELMETRKDRHKDSQTAKTSEEDTNNNDRQTD